MEIETYSSSVGAFAVKTSETSADLIYDFFQSICGRQFLFMGNENYLDFVPVKDTSNPFTRYGRQLLILFKHSFYSPSYTPLGKTTFQAKEPEETKGTETDFFCSEKASNQILWEGKAVRILYPDNPIVERHFLFATKEHRDSFKDMSKEEFLEIMDLAKSVSALFEGKKIYLCKTGYDAGQTVPHFHLHLMIETSASEGIWGRLKVASNILFNMIPFFSTRLRGADLESRVSKYKGELICRNS